MGTIIVGIIVFMMIFFAGRSVYKDFKQGKCASCGCGCGKCGGCAGCSTAVPNKK